MSQVHCALVTCMQSCELGNLFKNIKHDSLFDRITLEFPLSCKGDAGTCIVDIGKFDKDIGSWFVVGIGLFDCNGLFELLLFALFESESVNESKFADPVVILTSDLPGDTKLLACEQLWANVDAEIIWGETTVDDTAGVVLVKVNDVCKVFDVNRFGEGFGDNML